MKTMDKGVASMNNEITQIWNATLYLRLSREDGDKEESNSITGQRELLRDYLKAYPELREYNVRVDDGFSGSTFERPAFKAMLEDVKAGKTNCIVVKDLSRFGRNYLDAGEYIEKVFPFLGVRFIAINDNYDSFKGRSASDDLIVPFKNLINEAYCRDISVKIRSQLDIKRKRGQFIGAFAVYGYMKDTENKNRLVVDNYAADIVRDIFKWKLEGVSPQDIAVRLNDGGILSPLEYKKSLGMNYTTPFQTNARAAWSAGNVLRILKNPVYTGVLTQGKETTPSYKVHKRISKPENEWSIIPDNHEAIISRADFDTVQKVLSMDTRRGIEDETVYLFSGMVFCGECGASMVRKTVPSGEKKYVYYVCSANKQDKSCSSHAIRDKELEEIVLTTLQRYIREVIDMDTLLAMADTVPLQTAEAQKLQRQVDVKRSELERLNKLLMSLYENLADNIITRDEYARLKQNYSFRAEEAERQMNALQDALTELREKGGSGKAWMEHFRKYENLTELDRSAVVSLVDRILVHDDKCVEICYRWQDEFEWQLDILSRAAKEAV
jgi:site-specific DNA recombinase